MKVLTITTFEDYKTGGGPTAVIEFPEGAEEDEVYLLWHNKEYETNLTRLTLDREMTAGRIENAWGSHEVVTLTSLKAP